MITQKKDEATREEEGSDMHRRTNVQTPAELLFGTMTGHTIPRQLSEHCTHMHAQCMEPTYPCAVLTSVICF